MRRTQLAAALAMAASVAMGAAQVPAGFGAPAAQWHARPEAIAQANKQQPGFNYDESRVELVAEC